MRTLEILRFNDQEYGCTFWLTFHNYSPSLRIRRVSHITTYNISLCVDNFKQNQNLTKINNNVVCIFSIPYQPHLMYDLFASPPADFSQYMLYAFLSCKNSWYGFDVDWQTNPIRYTQITNNNTTLLVKTSEMYYFLTCRWR